MIVKRLKATLAYTLGKGADDPRQPEIIAGSKEEFERVCAVSHSTQKYKHFVLSYAVEDRPDRATLQEDLALFLNHISRGRSELDVAYVAVLHKEAAGDQIGDREKAREAGHRFAVHVLIAEVDLATGKRLQLFYSPAHRRALTAWQSGLNRARGYQDPTDPRKRRSRKPRYSQKDLNDRILQAAAATLHATRGGSTRTPEAWAEILRPYADGARLDCYEKGGTLWARLTPPGFSSASVLKLLPNGSLSMRAAKARDRHRQTVATSGVARIQATAHLGQRILESRDNHSGKIWSRQLERHMARLLMEQEGLAGLVPFNPATMRRLMARPVEPKQMDDSR